MLLLLTIAPRTAKAEDILMVQYIPWWGTCWNDAAALAQGYPTMMDGGRYANKRWIPNYDPTGYDSSLVRSPDVDDNGLMDGMEDYPAAVSGGSGSRTAYAGQSYMIDKQLQKMRKAGVKVVSVELGNIHIMPQGQLFHNACVGEHVDSLVSVLNAHPEYGIKFIISYTPVNSYIEGITDRVTLEGDWCADPRKFTQFRQDMDKIYNRYVHQPSYWRPVLNGESRPVAYIYAAWSFMRGGCQLEKQQHIFAAKGQDATGAPRSAYGRFYFIGDIGWDLRSEGGSDYYAGYNVFDAASNMGEAGIYDQWAKNNCWQGTTDDAIVNQRTQYRTLNQYTNELRTYLLGTTVGAYPSRVDRFAANTVHGESYKQNYVGGISVYTNPIRRTLIHNTGRYDCPAWTYRSIAGQDGDYVQQFRNQMNMIGRKTTRISAGNLPFGLTLVGTWNGHDEGTGIETTVGFQPNVAIGGDLRRGVRCRPDLYPGDPAPSFPYYVNASTLWEDNCTGDFFLDAFKKYWNLVFWLPTPGAPTYKVDRLGNRIEVPPAWPLEQSGYDIPRNSMSGVTIGKDELLNAYVYQFPVVNQSAAYAMYAVSRWTNGFTFPDASGFPTKFSVEATIRRKAPFLERKMIASNWYNYIGWNFHIGDNNELSFLWTADGVMNGTGGWQCPAAQILDENWHKVGASLGDGTLKLYIDDVEVCSLSGYANWIDNVYHQLTIGNTEGGIGGWMGSIREVKVYAGRLVPER